jgi:circadian clock protein KaiB
MRRKAAQRGASGGAVATIVVMRLYIANNAPNSVRAVANLEAICNEHLKDKFKLEIIDVLETPLRALADGILVTPSLTKMSPSPAAKVIGNLSDTKSVLHALGIVESVE